MRQGENGDGAAIVETPLHSRQDSFVALTLPSSAAGPSRRLMSVQRLPVQLLRAYTARPSAVALR
jgi:hypothetical protein